MFQLKFSVHNWDIKESSLCKSGFDDGFSVRGMKFEIENAGSIKVLYFFAWDFEESVADFLFLFCGVFESCIAVEGAQPAAPWISFSSFRCWFFLNHLKSS